MPTQFKRARAMTLSVEQTIGLDFRWCLHWNDNAEINKVIHCAYLTPFSERISQALENNQGSDRPINWAQLSRSLGRDEKHLRRSKSAYKKASEPDGDLVTGGKNHRYRKRVLPDTLIRYSFSFALGVPESELSLSTENLIAEATRFLVQRHRGGETISKSEARGYGYYVFAGPRRHDHTGLAHATLRQLLNDPGDWRNAGELSQAILNVAQLVGEILLSDFDALLEQAGWFGGVDA